MMSASEGEMVTEKGGCVNFILKVRSKYRQGKGVKNPKFLRTSYLQAPKEGKKEGGRKGDER